MTTAEKYLAMAAHIARYIPERGQPSPDPVDDEREA